MMIWYCFIMVLWLPHTSPSKLHERLNEHPLPVNCSIENLHDVQVKCYSEDKGIVRQSHLCHIQGHRTFNVLLCNYSHRIPNEIARIKRQAFTEALGGLGTAIGMVGGPVGVAIGGAVGGVVGLVIDVVCSFFCHKEPPQNKAPKIAWDRPSKDEYFAKPNERGVVVKWNIPTASDPEDGTIKANLKTHKKSGSRFEEGYYTIIYMAQDSGGLSDYAEYSFRVRVHRCRPVPHPHHGYVTYDDADRILGSTCSYSCNEGYNLKGKENRECQKNETFSGDAPTCETRNCKLTLNGTENETKGVISSIKVTQVVTCPNSTMLYPANGHPFCEDSNYEYDEVCVTHCNEGYSIQNFLFTRCKATGRWSMPLPPCQDATPPEIVDCPNSIHQYADRGGSFAVVTWKVPSVKDNSGETIIAKQTIGHQSGGQFDVGFNEIRYIATDSTGNTSPECIFFVHVEKQICDPPVIIDQFLVIDCPNGLQYGSSCDLSCRGSYPLIGNNIITCERNVTNSKTVYWDWGPGREPYCKQNNCPTLVPPKNGALTCDAWMYGRQCMMHCNENYDIPAGTGSGSVARFTGQFTCSTSSGKWSPAGTVPGCTVTRNPLFSNLPGEIYYYAGSCNDTNTQDVIKENFIKEMQIMQSDPGWEGICPNADDCNVENVDLQCGMSRKRRNADKYRQKRVSHQAEIVLSFDIKVKWSMYGNSSRETFQHLDTKAKNIGSLIQKKVQDGVLDVQSASIDKASFRMGISSIKCESGRYARRTTLTCASCPLGSIFDDTQHMCVECPKGTYREDDKEVTCSTCPPQMSTSSSGAKNKTECRPVCGKGHFSSDGIEPCSPCFHFQYGPNLLATKCEECPSGKMTSAAASTRISDCLAFDAEIEAGIPLNEINTITNVTQSLSLALWVKFPMDQDVSLQFLIIKNRTQGAAVDFGKDLNVTLHGHETMTGIALKTGRWQHIAITWNSVSSSLNVYVQGTKQFSSTLTSIPPIIAAAGSKFMISSKGFPTAVAVISGLLLTTFSMSDREIKQLSSECFSGQNGHITMDSFKNIDIEGIVMLSPSTCDAQDDCHPNPCNGQRCIDELNSFTCQCSGGYTGDTCQIPPDFCKNHKCANGASCHSMQKNYSCSCTPGFKGRLCDYKIVDGGWSVWSNWSVCSKTCGGGIMQRRRHCDDPYPDPDGKNCTGLSFETETCNSESCPVCPHPPRSYGSKMDCNTTSDLITCQAECRSGMWFVPGYPPLAEYKCGKETNYQWNGKPPSCCNVYSPSKLETSSVIEYDSTSCSNRDGLQDAIRQSTLQNLQCALNNTCSIDVDVEGCNVRSKRSLNGVKAVINIQIPLAEGDNLDMEGFLKSHTASPALMNILRALTEIETSTQQLNKSRDILKVEVDGHTYDVLTVVSKGSVGCGDGKVQIEAMCTDCPQGTYKTDGETCLPCGYGTYQDQTGASVCKDCPRGFSTDLIGATDALECSVALPDETDTHPDEDDGPSLGIIIGCTLGAIAVCGIIAGLGLRHYFRQKSRKQNMGSFASMNMVHTTLKK